MGIFHSRNKLIKFISGFNVGLQHKDVVFMEMKQKWAFIFFASLFPPALAVKPTLSTTEFKVSGEINPGVCSVNIHGDGVHYGNMFLKNVSSITSDEIELGTKSIAYSIQCPQKAQVWLMLDDNYAGAVPELWGDKYFGLAPGKSKDGENINLGGYQVTLTELYIDGDSAGLVNDMAGKPITPGRFVVYSMDKIITTGKVFTGLFNVKAKIINPKLIDMDSAVNFSGSARVTISYY
ncbi:hypothetical protein yruck0001_26300 [Yersinia ruckeri ATCC 29473]|nr:hypothetical protein yruck0001_26300 [Yersinia ruckeri ATCC 29473]